MYFQIADVSYTFYHLSTTKKDGEVPAGTRRWVLVREDYEHGKTERIDVALPPARVEDMFRTVLGNRVRSFTLYENGCWFEICLGPTTQAERKRILQSLECVGVH